MVGGVQQLPVRPLGSSRRSGLSVARPWMARLGVFLVLLVGLEWFMFLLAPAFVLLPIRSVTVRRVYRNYLSTLQLIFFGFVAFVFEIIFSIKLSIFGAEELLERCVEKPFIVANHRTRLDWFFVICVCLRLRRLSSVKIALKREITRVPIFGWAVQCFLFPALSRLDKDRDLKTLKDVIEYHSLLAIAGASVSASASHTASNCTLVIFPEGTDLSDTNVARCNEFQAARNAPLTKHVLAPKVAGFAQALETLKDANAVDALLDLTFGFVDFQPFERPDERAVFASGRFPREVHVNIDVVDWRDLPQDKDTAQHFLNQAFHKKEHMLSAFYLPLALQQQQQQQQQSASSGCSISSSAVGELSGGFQAQWNSDGNQSECSSTQLSSLEPVLQFVDVEATNEPLEETLTKDIRFVQYALNSFVIVVFLALMIHVAICFALYSWPAQLLSYCVGVFALGLAVTHLLGGFDRLEMEIFRPDFSHLSREYMYAQALSHRAAAARARASPRAGRTRDSFWVSLVQALGLPGSTARRSAYIDTVRHRAALAKAGTNEANH